METKHGTGVVGLSSGHPKLVTWTMLLTTLALFALAGLPTLWPESARVLNPVAIDTDPENMLSPDEPVRVFHNDKKREFSLHDIVVVGIANETNPDGVFNVESLARIYDLAEFALTLKWPDPRDPERRIGVVEPDILAPSLVDNIEQAGLGAVSFDWLMPAPPKTREEALAVRDRAREIPLFDGTLVSEDGKALSLYLPLTSKDLSYRVRGALLDKVAGWGQTGDAVYITGLPVAEDTFGVEMFIQMGISAPLAMIVIFLVMWWFFRHVRLILAPMIVAMVSAGSTMALLVITGNTIHIMSSMIPIFIMPIAVLDAVHILSEFFDRYPRTRDRRRTMREVMDDLFKPMLFTSLTTAAGFASLALTPIPPVQVFGVFVAIGVLLAWFWTITFVPAFVTFIPEEKLAGFGHRGSDRGQGDGTAMSRWLARLGGATYRRAKLVLTLTIVAVAVAGYGIAQININDNPVKWFQSSHPIRVADRVLNEHFGGTYMAYLALEPGEDGESLAEYVDAFLVRLKARRQVALDEGLTAAAAVFGELDAIAPDQAQGVETKSAFLSALEALVEARADAASARSTTRSIF
ncbi:MAG: RND family transporter [Alphaproteobacteria bacterium]